MGGRGEAPEESLGSVKVLLVEDERASGMVIEQHLAAIRSVRCHTHLVTSLKEALERLSRERYDLVIADLHLPDSAATETVAALVRACDYPVIALTVDESTELRARAAASGAYDYLLKGQLGDGSLERPVRLAALHARTLDSLRRSEERFRKLTELSADWYWEQDAEFRLTFMSRLAEKTGLDASAYLGRRRWDQPALNLSEADWASATSRSAISRCSARHRARAAAGFRSAASRCSMPRAASAATVASAATSPSTSAPSNGCAWSMP